MAENMLNAHVPYAPMSKSSVAVGGANNPWVVTTIAAHGADTINTIATNASAISTGRRCRMTYSVSTQNA